MAEYQAVDSMDNKILGRIARWLMDSIRYTHEFESAFDMLEASQIAFSAFCYKDDFEQNEFNFKMQKYRI